MLPIIEFLRKRPSDIAIRLIRILFGAIIAVLLLLDFSALQIWLLPQTYQTYVKDALFVFPVFFVLC